MPSLQVASKAYELTSLIATSRRREITKERKQRVEEKQRLEEMKAKVCSVPSLN
jgi:hypothetical protein